MENLKFRALVEYEGLGKVWEYYHTFMMPMWLEPNVAKIIVKDLLFTGLTDKNGKDFYEGDIVGFDDGTPIGKIAWNKNNAQLIMLGKTIEQAMFYTKSNYIVLGNIYENPELLKK